MSFSIPAPSSGVTVLSSSQTLYRSFPCQARKARSRRCSSSSQKVCRLFGSPCGHRTVISHLDYYSIFKVQLRRSFTCSHWKEQNYRVFLKNFLFCKKPLHSFGQRGPKCTPISELFLENFLRKNFTLHLFGIETPKRNLFLRKNLKIGKKYARRKWRARNFSFSTL